MKILNISTNTHGGAGSAALRIHQAFLSQGLQSYLLVKSNLSKYDQRVFEIKTKKWGIIQKIIKRLLMQIIFRKEYLMYSVFNNVSFVDLNQLIDELNVKPDIIILHWVADFIDIADLVKVKNKYPEIKFYWFLMDMAPVTAGCHYSWGCDNYSGGCHSCPAARTRVGKLIVRNKFKAKFKVLKEINLRYLAPNIFVRDQVRKVPDYVNTKTAYIPIDDSIFTPGSIERNDFSILFGSDNFIDHRKGADLFLKVLLKLDNLLAKNNIANVKVIMPGFKDHDSFNFQKLQILEVDRAHGEHELANVYRRSDVFVCCSREDSGPMMISESMMSGVPVVSFKVGVAPELIIDNEGGYLIDGYDVNEMAKTLFEMYSGALTPSLKRSVRAAAENKLSQKQFVRNFMEIET